MLTIKLFGDKQGEKFIWSIAVVDSRGTQIVTDGAADSESDAKASMLVAFGELVEKLEFSPIKDAEVS